MKRTACVALLLCALCSSTFAIGALYARQAGSSNDSKPLWLESYQATVKITDQIAVTHVDQTFKNESAVRMEGIFIFPLPDNAIVTELALWINGQRVVGSVMESDTARSVYQNTVRRSIDPALLEYLGNNIFKLSVFPIEANGNAMSERRIEITYAELLPLSTNQVEYKFFMKAVSMSSKPVSTALVDFDVTSQKNIVSITSPTHTAPELSIVKSGTNHYIGTCGNENTLSEKDFKLDYQVENTVYSLNLLTYVPSGMFFDTTGDNPYYALWITPPDTAKPIKKNIAFVADISSSMSGTRIAQLKQSLEAMVNILAPSDMFNIIAFSTSVQKFKDSLITADAANKALAVTFINQLTEMGLTNMQDAFKVAFKCAWDDTSANAIVFLTDGKPTWPDTNSLGVIDSVAAQNKDHIAVFSFGIGDQVGGGFLKRLAMDNNGFATMIAADDSISSIMNTFMHAISYPLIKNISVNYGGMVTSDVLPNPLPNLYAGKQLTLLGRYKNAGTYSIAFKGTRGSDSVTLQQSLAFPSSAENQPFVARMWASSKINWLLDEIAIYGENAELKNAVITLGKKYSIITPYTSMLVIEPTSVLPVEDKTTLGPQKLALMNSPNPFKNITTIKYSIPKMSFPQKVSIKIFNARGCLIRTLVNDVTMGGNFIIRWDVKNDKGLAVPAGMYFAILETGNGMHSILSMKVIR
jgi:Vault protein inter-alpha-trypsin./von Willebrand factor type A domain.